MPSNYFNYMKFEKEEQGVELHDTVDKIVKGTFVLKQV